MEFVSSPVFCRFHWFSQRTLAWMKLPNITMPGSQERAEGKLNRTRQEPAFRRPPSDRPINHKILFSPRVLRQQLFLKTEE